MATKKKKTAKKKVSKKVAKKKVSKKVAKKKVSAKPAALSTAQKKMLAGTGSTFSPVDPKKASTAQALIKRDLAITNATGNKLKLTALGRKTLKASK